MKHESYKNSSQKQSLLYLSFEILMFILTFSIFLRFGANSTFVIVCPNQYGIIVLSLFMTGVVSTASYYIYLNYTKKITRPISQLFNCLGLIIIGILFWQTIYGKTFLWSEHIQTEIQVFQKPNNNNYNEKKEIIGLIVDSKFDTLAALTATLAILLLLINIFESNVDTHKDRFFWRLHLLFVNAPLSIVSCSVLLFKLFIFNFASESYNNLSAAIYSPDIEFGKEIISYSIHEGMRTNFWIGFSTGVLVFQILISKVIATLIDVIASHPNYLDNSK